MEGGFIGNDGFEKNIPMMGPRRGPKENKAIALPLFSGTIRSAIDPAPIVKDATPAHPAKKRKTRKHPMFGDSPQTMLKTRKSRLQL